MLVLEKNLPANVSKVSFNGGVVQFQPSGTLGRLLGEGLVSGVGNRVYKTSFAFPSAYFMDISDRNG